MEIQNPFQVVWEKPTTTNFAEYFFKKIAKYGTQHAMIDFDTGKQWRYSEFKQFSETCAARLRDIGVNSSSRVAIITSTTAQALFVHMANAIIGSTAVCINGYCTIDEIWQQVDLSESTHCVTEVQFLQKVEEVKRKAVMRGGGRIKITKTLDEVFSVHKIVMPPISKRESKSQLLIKEENQISPSVEQVSTPTSEKIEENSEIGENGDSLQSPQEEKDGSIIQQPKIPLFIFYSSGTTGLPKAVEVTHQSLIINLMQMSFPVYNVISGKDRFLLPLCVHHLFGTLSAYYSLINGATLILLCKYSPKSFLQAIRENKITLTHVTPPMIQMLTTDSIVKDYNLSSLRSIVVSGAPLDKNIAEQCRQKLELKDLRQAYGMTELSGLCTLPPYQNENIASVGVPLPGMLIRIVNWETKQLCEPNQVGQLHVVGPQVLPNFYRNPKATSEIIDSNKMVRTGDAGYYDKNGFIYVVGRVKDLIKYKGTLVYPSEVEAVMRTHPGIDDCAVVGRQDHVSGEVPAAFVVRNPNYPLLSSAEVRQHVAGKIAQFKELRGGVYFISEIPRTICGKVLRRQLKQHWDRERTVVKTDVANSGGQNMSSSLNGSATKKMQRSNNISRPSTTVKNSVDRRGTATRGRVKTVVGSVR
ncbi:hypothetical protein FO519_002531 [Halicephalobus sp. NKZ332]|nr:hypothetical protein FO519_002531 [Halicephalobus sp. NKZ332]